MKTQDWLVLGGIAALGLYLYSKSGASGSVPPMVVTGWNNGNAIWTLGNSSGTLSTANGGIGITTQTGTYTVQVNGYDGSGYNILVLTGGANGTLVNSLYVNGNGSFN
jgi:hypothetical protein